MSRLALGRQPWSEDVLQTVVDTGVPGLVFFTMVVVGLELTIEDFRRVARQPGTVVAATVGQFLLLPFACWLLVHFLGLKTMIAQGMLLVVACPSGAMANVYTYLGRGNVALSVTLTTVSCLAAVATTPLAMAALQATASEPVSYPVPVGVLAGQLVVLLVLPVVLGMSIRTWWPEVNRRHGRSLLGCSIAALATLLAFIIMQAAEQFVRSLIEITTGAALLTAMAFGSGWATGWVTGNDARDSFTLAMVFVVRNVGVATAIAVSVLGQVEFAVFATAYFLAQTPLLLAAALVFRHRTKKDIGHLAAAGAEFP